MVYVTKFEHLEGFRINVTFDDGTAGVADLRDLVKRRPFTAIAPPSEFAKTRLEGGTVCWAADVDIAPTLLYALAHALPRPRTFEAAQANLAAMRGR